jgi:hypothetical protein
MNSTKKDAPHLTPWLISGFVFFIVGAVLIFWAFCFAVGVVLPAIF